MSEVAIHAPAHRRPFWKTIPRFEANFGWEKLLGSLSMPATAREHEEGAPWAILEACKLPAGTRAYLIRTGRESLYLALKCLNLRATSKVGVPLFCCACVFEAIVAAGHVPVFLDVDLKTYTLDPDFVARKKREIDALVVVHTFGYPADLDQLQAALTGGNVPIIEDCAHSLFSEYKGRATGTWTELSLFSFGLRKPAAAGGGALLAINDPALAARADAECGGLRTEGAWRQFRHSLGCWCRSTVYEPSVYGAFFASPLGHVSERTSRTRRSTPAASGGLRWAPAEIRPADLGRVKSSIEEFRRKLERLGQSAGTLQAVAANLPVEMPREPSLGRWNHFWLPIRYRTERDRDLARRSLRAKRIDAPAIWPDCVRNAQRFGYEGGCERAEEAARTVCRIPIHSWLSTADLGYIAEAIRSSAGHSRRGAGGL